MQRAWRIAARGAALLGLGVSVVQGAIVDSQVVRSDEISFNSYLVWRPEAGVTDVLDLLSDPHWAVDFNLTGMSGNQPDVIWVFGRHLSTPFPGDVVPTKDWYEVVFSIAVMQGSGVLSTSFINHPAGGSIDKWTLEALRLAGQSGGRGDIRVTVDAIHIPVPEPNAYAVCAGLGLVALAFCRRSRRA